MSGEEGRAGGERAALPAGRVTRVKGTALALRGDDVDTDRIMPARFLRALTFEGLGEHVFEDDRQACALRGELHPFDAPRAASATILLVNHNFGCGSSREHAPQGLLRRGIRAIVGESFAEIFFGNAASLGIPCLVAERDAIDSLMNVVERGPGEPIQIDLEQMTAQGGSARVFVTLPAAVRAAFLDGTWDAMGLLLDDFGAVRAAAARLPYVRGF